MMKIIFTILPALSIGSPLSLPQFDDTNPDRQKEVDEVAAKIQNFPRSQTIYNESISLSPGLIPFPGTLAEEIFNVDLAYIFANTNPDDELIYGISLGLIDSLETVEDYQNMYEALQDTIEIPITQGLIDDVSFGQDRLTLKGNRLELVVENDLDIGLTSEEIENICNGEVSRNVRKRSNLRKFIKSKRIFKEDLSEAGKYKDPMVPSKYVPSVIAYYCVTEEEQFLPLAIHLTDFDLIYSKYDTENEWNLAKVAVNVAAYNIQQFDHGVETHFALEPIRVELLRNVHPSHPIYNLLNHHFLTVTGLFYVASDELLTAGRAWDMISGWGAYGSAKYYQDHYSTYMFKTQLQRMDENGLGYLPNYKVRDDSKKVYQAIRKFVAQHLKLYYYKKKDFILNDSELQSWARETSKYVNGFPSSIENWKDLVIVLSDIIFLIGFQHHAMNSDVTWHSFSLPYSIASLHAEWPSKKKEPFNLKDFLLPNELVPVANAFLAEFNRDMPINQTLLRSYTALNLDLGDKKKTKKAVQKFEEGMSKLEEFIDKRESSNDRPFTFTKPSRLPYNGWI